jgi:hypothetical protein
MTVPNAGPQQPEHADADGADIRRGNPALVRHPQTRSDRFPQTEHHPNDGGDPDASH